MPFKNFSIWRGRLPHWRADDVTYYATFRHRRPLEPAERDVLVKMLTRPDGRRWDLLILCVLPDKTDLIFRVLQTISDEPYELSKIIESAKSKAGKVIIKNSGERFPPFYSESYDRILRNEAELEERWQEIFESPVTYELVEDQDGYEGLWVCGGNR